MMLWIRHIAFLLVAAVMSVAVGMTSVLQFHHHDCDGRAYFTIDGLNDLVLCGFHSEFVQKCYQHSHNHDGHRSESHDHSDDCSLHFTDFYGDDQDQSVCLAATFPSEIAVEGHFQVYVRIDCQGYSSVIKIPDEYARAPRRGPPLNV